MSSWKEFCYNLHETYLMFFFFLHDILHVLRHIKNAQHKGKILYIAHCQIILSKYIEHRTILSDTTLQVTGCIGERNLGKHPVHGV